MTRAVTFGGPSGGQQGGRVGEQVAPGGQGGGGGRGPGGPGGGLANAAANQRFTVASAKASIPFARAKSIRSCQPCAPPGAVPAWPSDAMTAEITAKDKICPREVRDCRPDAVLLDLAMRPIAVVALRPGRLLLPRPGARHIVEVAA